MRYRVELEDGKTETIFMSSAALRAADLAEDFGPLADRSPIDISIFTAWWTFKDRGLTDADDWETFGRMAFISPVKESDDPKAEESPS